MAGVSLTFVFLALLIAGFYFLPTIVSSMRGVAQSNGVILLNLFLGWTVIGWLGALIWASTAETKMQAALREAAYRSMVASGNYISPR